MTLEDGAPAEQISCQSSVTANIFWDSSASAARGAVYLAQERSTSLKRVVKFYDKNCANAPVEDIVEDG